VTATIAIPGKLDAKRLSNWARRQWAHLQASRSCSALSAIRRPSGAVIDIDARSGLISQSTMVGATHTFTSLAPYSQGYARLHASEQQQIAATDVRSASGMPSARKREFVSR
jgi:hypothetical protein